METKFTSDHDIAAEFDGFIITSITHDHTGSAGSRSGYITILWPHGGDHVGGGVENDSETTDSWIDYDGDGCKIAFNGWYPEHVYFQLCAAIRAYLKR